MLIKTTDGWKLAEHTVIYARYGETVEQPVGSEGKGWWLDFAEKWPDTEIIEFTDLHYTDEQLARLAEIQAVSGNEEVLEQYVLDGTFPEGDHPLTMLQLQKENAQLKTLLADLTEVVLLGGV